MESIDSMVTRNDFKSRFVSICFVNIVDGSLFLN